MPFQTRKYFFILPALFFCLLTSCIERNLAHIPDFVVNLHTGIKQMARLGESEASVLARTKNWGYKRLPLPSGNSVPFSAILYYPHHGVRIYFKRGLVALIEIQEPFKGRIMGKKLQLFAFAVPTGESWRNTLVREFGPPRREAAGGRLRSHSLFYSWGDVAFNGMGPNQIAIHRDHQVTEFRKKHFGRVIEIFGGH